MVGNQVSSVINALFFGFVPYILLLYFYSTSPVCTIIFFCDFFGELSWATAVNGVGK